MAKHIYGNVTIPFNAVVSEEDFARIEAANLGPINLFEFSNKGMTLRLVEGTTAFTPVDWDGEHHFEIEDVEDEDTAS
ncbi:MAG: hypothetical protein ACRDRJ_03070 [Streptosporangiaceae bacterium]